MTSVTDPVAPPSTTAKGLCPGPSRRAAGGQYWISSYVVGATLTQTPKTQAHENRFVQPREIDDHVANDRSPAGAVVQTGTERFAGELVPLEDARERRCAVTADLDSPWVWSVSLGCRCPG